MAALGVMLDRRVLRRLAGARAFERGSNYAVLNRVRALAEGSDGQP